MAFNKIQSETPQKKPLTVKELKEIMTQNITDADMKNSILGLINSTYMLNKEQGKSDEEAISNTMDKLYETLMRKK